MMTDRVTRISPSWIHQRHEGSIICNPYRDMIILMISVLTESLIFEAFSRLGRHGGIDRASTFDSLLAEQIPGYTSSSRSCRRVDHRIFFPSRRHDRALHVRSRIALAGALHTRSRIHSPSVNHSAISVITAASCSYVR